MAIESAVTVYTAANNWEAYFVQDLLRAADVEAFAVADMSPAGVWELGCLPQVHKPQVWTDQRDLAAANAVLDDYELRMRSRDELHEEVSYCYQCGEDVGSRAAFCSACGMLLERPPPLPGEREMNGGDCHRERNEPDGISLSLESLRGLKKPFAWYLLTPYLLVLYGLTTASWYDLVYAILTARRFR